MKTRVTVYAWEPEKSGVLAGFRTKLKNKVVDDTFISAFLATITGKHVGHVGVRVEVFGSQSEIAALKERFPHIIKTGPAVSYSETPNGIKQKEGVFFDLSFLPTTKGSIFKRLYHQVIKGDCPKFRNFHQDMEKEGKDEPDLQHNFSFKPRMKKELMRQASYDQLNKELQDKIGLLEIVKIQLEELELKKQKILEKAFEEKIKSGVSSIRIIGKLSAKLADTMDNIKLKQIHEIISLKEKLLSQLTREITDIEGELTWLRNLGTPIVGGATTVGGNPDIEYQLPEGIVDPMRLLEEMDTVYKDKPSYHVVKFNCTNAVRSCILKSLNTDLRDHLENTNPKLLAKKRLFDRPGKIISTLFDIHKAKDEEEVGIRLISSRKVKSS